MQRDSKEQTHGTVAFAAENDARSSSLVKRSLDSFVQRSFEQSKGMTCIFAPEDVEPSSPLPNDQDQQSYADPLQQSLQQFPSPITTNRLHQHHQQT